MAISELFARILKVIGLKKWSAKVANFGSPNQAAQQMNTFIVNRLKQRQRQEQDLAINCGKKRAQIW